MLIFFDHLTLEFIFFLCLESFNLLHSQLPLFPNILDHLLILFSQPVIWRLELQKPKSVLINRLWHGWLFVFYYIFTLLWVIFLKKTFQLLQRGCWCYLQDMLKLIFELLNVLITCEHIPCSLFYLRQLLLMMLWAVVVSVSFVELQHFTCIIRPATITTLLFPSTLHTSLHFHHLNHINQCPFMWSNKECFYTSF